MLDYCVLLSLLTLVCSAEILKSEDANVSVGEDARFSCELPGADGVKQVIWQRDDGNLRNMVTFTERSKPHVEDAFVGKVNITVASLHKTAIVIKNVTFEDEACYICTFNVYPTGTKMERACLSVTGLSEITSLLISNPKEKDAVVSCSATGKPTPVISWWSGEKELSSYSLNHFTVQNEDSSVSTTSKLTIPKSQFTGNDVKCVAKSGGLTRSENIFVGKQTDTETPEVTSRYYVVSAFVVISCIVVAIFVVILLHRKRKKPEKPLFEI